MSATTCLPVIISFSLSGPRKMFILQWARRLAILNLKSNLHFREEIRGACLASEILQIHLRLAKRWFDYLPWRWNQCCLPGGFCTACRWISVLPRDVSLLTSLLLRAFASLPASPYLRLKLAQCIEWTLGPFVSNVYCLSTFLLILIKLRLDYLKIC